MPLSAVYVITSKFSARKKIFSLCSTHWLCIFSYFFLSILPFTVTKAKSKQSSIVKAIQSPASHTHSQRERGGERLCNVEPPGPSHTSGNSSRDPADQKQRKIFNVNFEARSQRLSHVSQSVVSSSICICLLAQSRSDISQQTRWSNTPDQLKCQ